MIACRLSSVFRFGLPQVGYQNGVKSRFTEDSGGEITDGLYCFLRLSDYVYHTHNISGIMQAAVKLMYLREVAINIRVYLCLSYQENSI